VHLARHAHAGFGHDDDTTHHVAVCAGRFRALRQRESGKGQEEEAHQCGKSHHGHRFAVANFRIIATC